MSAGTDASNFGYSNIAPNSNINGNYINVDNSHSPALFGSNVIPGTNGLPGLTGAQNNINAAAGYVPNICFFKGGKSKQFKNKIKKILNKYKMKNNSKKITKRQIKRMVSGTMNENTNRSRTRGRTRTRTRTRARARARTRTRARTRARSRSMRGGSFPLGYSQYQNNLPMTQTYSVGGNLTPNQLAEANPPPVQVLSNCTNCTDNYNHFTGKGFASRGH